MNPRGHKKEAISVIALKAASSGQTCGEEIPLLFEEPSGLVDEARLWALN